MAKMLKLMSNTASGKNVCARQANTAPINPAASALASHTTSRPRTMSIPAMDAATGLSRAACSCSPKRECRSQATNPMVSASTPRANP